MTDDDSRNTKDIAQATLAWLETQQVEPAPKNYSVGFEHLSGGNPKISQSLTQTHKTGNALEEELQQLYQDHFSTLDDERMEGFRAGLQQILQQALAITQHSQADTKKFHATLERSRDALSSEPTNLNQVLQIISELVTETKRMDQSLVTMENELHQTSDEVSLLKEQFDHMRNEVFTDPLTNALNRRGMDNAMRRLTAKTGAESTLSLLMIDLDNFKPFNDMHGHLVGDQVLCFAAKMLRIVTRGSDIIARYGGDEFAVLLPNTSVAEAKTVADNILTAFQKNKIKRRSTGEVLGTLSASIGVAQLEDNESLEDLVERADKGLYASKRNGRNQVTHLSMEKDLRK
tara:strand:+ start:15670 stop:16707 length:1038 start_codon:yes stop_codon:yes gene_type:complete